jgi:hypothetical protein
MSTPSYVYNGALPGQIKDLLTNWPASRTGTRQVHRHILSIANQLRHHVPAEQAVELIRAAMPRRRKGREIEETVERAYNLKKIRKIDTPPVHCVDITLIEQIVAERIGPKSALAELEEKSPAPIPDSTDQIIRTLFRHDSILCVGWQLNQCMTAALSNLDDDHLGAYQFIVPSPMSAFESIDSDGRRHQRCLANTGPRRFIVCDIDIKPGPNSPYNELIERWAKFGVTVQDAAAALIGYLAEHGPLTMVVFSGNISLQAWFYCQGESESANSQLRVFFENAVILGVDRSGWTRCQFFRMPGATRSDTGHRQTVHYFNPELINQGVEVDEDQDN